MKLHYLLLKSVVATLNSIFHDHKKADKAIMMMLKSNPKWGSRDRAFIAKYSYELVRWWRYLHYLNGSDMNNHSHKIIWQLLGIQLMLEGVDLPDIKEFFNLNKEKINSLKESATKLRKIRESIPDWLEEVGTQELGERWDDIIHGLNQTASVYIRANTIKVSFEDLSRQLGSQDVELQRDSRLANGGYIDEKVNLFGLEPFKLGLFEVQDGGSQLIAEYLDVKPGMRVIDACAGAGGKSLHLACMMQNKGTLIALDVEDYKLQELKRRAKRNGIHNIDTRLIEAKTIKRLRESADAVLLDVPCTGLGVLRRNPDAKWKMKKDFLNEITQKQQQILAQYALMVKPGGTLVYATCSILPSENENQVKKFLNANPQFELVSEQQTYPHTDGFDGFYMAKIHRKKLAITAKEIHEEEE